MVWNGWRGGGFLVLCVCVGTSSHFGNGTLCAPFRLSLNLAAMLKMIKCQLLCVGFLCVVSKHVCARAALTQTFCQLSRNFADAQKVGIF